jgi:hypothetical protein
MPNYNCKLCGFNSTNKKNYSNHILTKKHLKKNDIDLTNSSAPSRLSIDSVKEKNELFVKKSNHMCNFCHNTFTRLNNLTRHQKTCGKMDIITEKVKMLEKENERIQKEATEKEEIFKKQLETYEVMLKSFTTPQTINYFNYIVQNYPNAPALTCQESYTNLIEATTMTLIDVISMYHYDKKLVTFIGLTTCSLTR